MAPPRYDCPVHKDTDDLSPWSPISPQLKFQGMSINPSPAVRAVHCAGITRRSNMAILCMFLLAVSATSAMGVPGKCGVPVIKPDLMVTDRIEGGEEVVPGSWPWHAEINSAANEHLCSGALISDQHVVTAAKCLWKLRSGDLHVHLGSHTRNQKDDGEVFVKVAETCVYPTYNDADGHKNNIAVIRLQEKVKFTDRIQPVCLPEKNQRLPGSVYGTGWGHSHVDHTHAHDHDHDHDHAHDHAHDDERAPRLRQALVDVVPSDQCYNEFGEDVPVTVFCTTLRKGSPCKHDLGGPIVQKQGDVWTLFGVVSGGAAGCKVGEHPMLHTKVSLYLDSLVNYYVNAAPGSADSKHCLLV